MSGQSHRSAAAEMEIEVGDRVCVVSMWIVIVIRSLMVVRSGVTVSAKQSV